MQPHSPPPTRSTRLEQFPAPGPVQGLAGMLWGSAAISLLMLVINMATAPMFGVDPGYAYGHSMSQGLTGLLLAVPAIFVMRGHSWARKMAKVILIIQIVLQAGLLLSGTSPLWALFLLPPAIIGVVLLHHRLSQWFFTFHSQAAGQGYMQYAAHYPHPQAGQGYYPQTGRGYYPPQQYPQQAYEQQPQSGSWNQGPQQQ